MVVPPCITKSIRALRSARRVNGPSALAAVTALASFPGLALVATLALVAALAAALGRMLDDRALRTSLAERAFESVRDMTWTRSAVATLAVYERALEADGHP